MKFFIRTIQFLVAFLFIISGLVKANDPLGLGYKMQEFFELWTGGLSTGHFFLRGILIKLFDFLHDHSLILSILMITLEIVTGVALLIGVSKKFILNLLLLLILFFTFLTGYAYLSGKFTNCGCFGDCLPITPLTSFSKDVLLLVMIIILIAGQRYIMPLITKPLRTTILSISLFLSIILQWYSLNYLPLVDCLPFKKVNNILVQMKPPANALPDSFAIKFIYEKEGKRFEFTPDNLPADFGSYKFIDRKQELVRKGNADPAIKSFSLAATSGEDSTEVILNEPEVLLLFIQEFDHSANWLIDFKKVVDRAHQKNIPVYAVTSDPEAIKNEFLRNGLNVQVLTCDYTAIRTAARTNPTLYILKKGTITSKYGLHQTGNAALDL
jgi:uncharacterized membrane protein YphA (DoxX/SURF4 family)